MNSKLTLTIEKEVIEIAKQYAKANSQSLSEMVENYFRFVTNRKPSVKQKKLSSRVTKLKGIIKVNDDIDYNTILTQELFQKYISNH